MELKHINPGNMAKPRGYSHAISVKGNYKTIYIGGQNAIDGNENLIGKNNFKEQTEQVLINIEKILESIDAKFENIIKFNINILQGQNPQEGFQVFQQKWKDNDNFPAVTVLFVAGLGNPDWLVEIDAIAVISE
ncbi:RidA family protein [Leptospira ilyithenensis]|uniref:RidA family protein n=1 Tax=Leptospira ilyithenensis TaxID=2484901 RepID=A0A4R9LT62_9LEPT|nr:RidA family protein [Leptospira ilyithenensis]TGN13386.1 RidA family protein [Leptospira ilyithenensis]